MRDSVTRRIVQQRGGSMCVYMKRTLNIKIIISLRFSLINHALSTKFEVQLSDNFFKQFSFHYNSVIKA